MFIPWIRLEVRSKLQISLDYTITVQYYHLGFSLLQTIAKLLPLSGVSYTGNFVWMLGGI